MGYGSGGTAANRAIAPVSRFRSFAERYVVARAEKFTTGQELREGWQALQDAKKLYDMIAEAEDPDARRGERDAAANEERARRQRQSDEDLDRILLQAATKKGP